MGLNVYEVSPRVGGPELEGFIWHVVAPTRGKARLLFLEEAACFYGDLEWTDPMSIRIKAKNVDYPEGVDETFKWARDTGYPMTFPEEMDDYAI